MSNSRDNREPFLNDDYSRYAGDDYQQDYESVRHLNMDRLSMSHGAGHFTRPGVSGKDRDDGGWFNRDEYQSQKSFIGKGPKGYRRADGRIREEVCEALTRSREVDATNIEVDVNNGVVTLKGSVPYRNMKKEAEWCTEELPGVEDVFNLLVVGKHSDVGVKALINNQLGRYGGVETIDEKKAN